MKKDKNNVNKRSRIKLKIQQKRMNNRKQMDKNKKKDKNFKKIMIRIKQKTKKIKK